MCEKKCACIDSCVRDLSSCHALFQFVYTLIVVVFNIYPSIYCNVCEIEHSLTCEVY